MPERNFSNRDILLFLCLLLSGALAACVPGAGQSATQAQPEPYFRPPAPAETAAPVSEPGAGAQTAGEGQITAPGQAAAVCENNLTFLRDVTIPDGTPVIPRSTMDKRWEVENSGSCGWNEQFRLRLIAGPAMDAQTEQALYPARSGTRAVLRILFQAPEAPGDYRSAWQAVGPDGEPFGDPFFIDIVVEPEAVGTSTAQDNLTPAP